MKRKSLKYIRNEVNLKIIDLSEELGNIKNSDNPQTRKIYIEKVGVYTALIEIKAMLDGKMSMLDLL